MTGQKLSFRPTLSLIAMAASLLALALTVALQEAGAQVSKPTPRTESDGTLSLATFLDQVARGNDGYKAAELGRQGAEGYAEEPLLALSPMLVAGATFSSDAKPSPFFPWERLETNSYSLGVSKLFAMGLQAKFSYGLTETSYVGYRPRYFEARPQIEATLPLWRNFWGAEIQSGAYASYFAAKAKAEGQRSLATTTLLEAEAAYWRLALTREALKVATDAVQRAQAIYDWTQRRVRLSLVDQSEGLQAIAQLKARKLDLKQSEDDERSARLAFNAARGVASDKVNENVTVLTAGLVAKWATPERTKNRPDVEAAKLQAQAAEAGARAAIERSKPNFELFGQYAFNSPQRATDNDAFSDSWRSEKPTSVYGVRLTMPLDIAGTRRAQEGWSIEAAAAKALVARKSFDQERDWNDVVARFQLAKEKIRLYEDLEQAQKDKLDRERERQRAGRTTLAQVILFQSDYEQTQFARIRSLADLLTLNAQMKLYGAAYEQAPSSN